jgi:hypothetical protein
MSFTQYDPTDIAINSEDIISPLWSGNATVLSASNFYTSSVQQSSVSGLSFLNVYQSPTYASGSEVQLSLAYANISGSGSAPFNQLVPGFTPTRTAFGQYRTLIYGDESNLFYFGSPTYPVNDFFIISIDRSRYKEGLQPGSLNLKLGWAGNTINLTDNSNESTDTSFIGSTEFYLIVSGSNGVSYNGNDVQTVNGSYGMFFPNLGIILLNPDALALSPAQSGIGMPLDETTSTSYVAPYSTNATNLLNALINGGSFGLQSYETVSSAYFFTRVKNQEYNYTTNPSIIDSNGNILFDSMVNNPQTFPTTVGLYNNNNELLAVAKLSKPLPKDFTKEMNLRVKLSF